MVKMNLKHVEELKKLPKGVFNIEVVEANEQKTEDNEDMLAIKHIVIDDEEFNGSPIYKNFMLNSEKAKPFLVQYLKAVGLTDIEIEGISDSKQLINLIRGKRLTVSYKPSKEFNWGVMQNPRKYNDA